MRIRKHAKISPLVYAAASIHPGAAVLQTHVCQLNQSPWDVMDFSRPPPTTTPPPPPQVVADAAPAANGSCGGRFSAGKSNFTDQQSLFSDDLPAKTAAVKSEEPLLPLPPSPPPPPPPPAAEQNEPGKITICSKTDGKNWKCKREASGSNTMCDHHVSQMKSYSKKPGPEPRRPARPKKAPSSNPHEFYYYSGFGPRWAKKRGSDCNNTSASASSNGNVEHRHEIEKNYYSSEDESESDELDYEDLEEDEEEEKNGRKRGRKPIKARSLKSLM